MRIFSNIVRISQTGTASLVNILTSLFRVKFIALIAGSDGVGILGQLANLNNIVSFTAVFGTTAGVVAEVAGARGSKDHERVLRIQAIFVLLAIIGSLFSALAIYLFSSEINQWLFPGKNYTFYIDLIAINSSLVGLALVPQTLLQAYNRIKRLMMYSVIVSIVNTLVIIAFLYLYQIDGVVVAFIVNSFLSVVIGLLIIKKTGIAVFDLSPRLWRQAGSTLQNILKYGFVSLLTSVSFQVGYALIKSIIIANDNLSTAGLYQSVANMSNQYLPVFLTSLSTYLLPQLAESKSNVFVKDANYSLRAIILLATPFMIGMVIFREFVLKILYSAEFLAASPLLGWIILADFIKIINRVMGTIIVVKKSFILWIVMDIVTIGSMVVGTYFLFPRFNLIGIAFASMISQVILFITYTQALKVKFNFVITKRVRVLSFMVIVVLISLNLVDSFMLQFFIGIVFCFIFYMAGLTKQEWLQIKTFLLQKMK